MLKCPKCPKEFKNEVALRMHDMRVHTKQIKTPGQLGLLTGKPFKQPWKAGGGSDTKWTPEQVELLLAIDEQYRRGKHVDWEQAFTDHPEWEDDLGNRKRAVLTQKLAYEKNKQQQPRSKDGIFPSWTPEEENVLLQVERDYSVNGQVKWKRAFYEHPEWKRQLKGRTSMSLGAKLKQLRRKTQGSSVQVIATRPRGLQKALQAAPTTNGEPVKVFKVDYCPHCGEHIQRWNYVAEVIATLPK